MGKLAAKPPEIKTETRKPIHEHIGTPAVFWGIVAVLILLGIAFAAIMAVAIAIWFKVI